MAEWKSVTKAGCGAVGVGYWGLVTGHWFLVAGFWSLVSGRWGLVTGVWPLMLVGMSTLTLIIAAEIFSSLTTMAKSHRSKQWLATSNTLRFHTLHRNLYGLDTSIGIEFHFVDTSVS